MISRTAAMAPSERIGVMSNGTAFLWTSRTVPFVEMNSMSSGIGVSFIQNEAGPADSYRNSIPAVECRTSRPCSPRARNCGVSAISTENCARPHSPRSDTVSGEHPAEAEPRTATASVADSAAVSPGRKSAAHRFPAGPLNGRFGRRGSLIVVVIATRVGMPRLNFGNELSPWSG